MPDLFKGCNIAETARPEYYAPLPDIGMALERIGLDPNGDYSPASTTSETGITI